MSDSEKLIEHTERVEVFGGPETHFRAVIDSHPFSDSDESTGTDSDSETRSLTFSNTEWVKNDSKTRCPPVIEKFEATFGKTLDVSWEEWSADIRPAWVEMQVIVADYQASYEGENP